MLSLTKENKDDKPLISLYKQEDFNFDYKLNPNIEKEDKILYYNNNNDYNISIDSDNDNEDDNNYLFIDDLKINNIQYIPYPYFEKNFFIKFLICGSSGAGKTTLSANLIKMMLNKLDNNMFVIYYTPNIVDYPLQKYFKKIFNGNCLFITPDVVKKTIEHNVKSKKKIKLLFSLEDLHNLQKIKNQPILCVYDDIEGTPNNEIKQLYIKSQKEVLVMGRGRNNTQKNISCIVINHKPLQGNSTSDVFNEANYICLHIKSISSYHLEEILKNKIGYDENIIKQILKLKKKNAGMCIFSKTYPYHILIHGENPGVILQT